MESSRNQMYPFDNTGNIEYSHSFENPSIPPPVSLYMKDHDGNSVIPNSRRLFFPDQYDSQRAARFIHEENNEIPLFVNYGYSHREHGGVYPIPNPVYSQPIHFIDRDMIANYNGRNLENPYITLDPRYGNRMSNHLTDYPPNKSYYSVNENSYVPHSNIHKERREFNYSSNLLPGETNPDAIQGEHLCYDFLKTGRCSRNIAGKVCRYRHLVPIHPDAIACKYRLGLLSEEEINRFVLRPCEDDEVNPFAPIDAPLCKDFLNHKVCERTKNMKICRYRHCLPHHPLAIEDKLRRKKEFQNKQSQKKKKI